MSDETDLRQEKDWYYARLAEKCISSLNRNGISAQFASDRAAAKSKLLELIPGSATIGLGYSVTLQQTGIIEELERRGHQVFNPFIRYDRDKPQVTSRDVIDIMKKALTADVFLLSANAVTLDGKLVNKDGLGNRMAGLLFGPKKVIVVAGANKIVNNVDDALKRIREIAAPINARRHHLRFGMPATPCAITGACSDCRSPHRNCAYTVIVEYQPEVAAKHQRLNVIMVGEELGI